MRLRSSIPWSAYVAVATAAVVLLVAVGVVPLVLAWLTWLAAIRDFVAVVAVFTFMYGPLFIVLILGADYSENATGKGELEDLNRLKRDGAFLRRHARLPKARPRLAGRQPSPPPHVQSVPPEGALDRLLQARQRWA